MNQSSSDGSYSYTNGYLTFAYTGVRFGENSDHYLVMAMQIGFISRKFDITKMQFGSQWAQGVGFDGSNPSQAADQIPAARARSDWTGDRATRDTPPRKPRSRF